MPEEVEKKLRREARKRKVRDKDAYVYGTLHNLGWKPKYTIEDGINELIHAYQMIIKHNNRNFTNL